MKYTLTRKTKQPNRGNIGDAGIDIYVPLFTKEFVDDFHRINLDVRWDYLLTSNRLYILGGKRVKLPTGTYFNIPLNNMLLVLEKTSVPYRTGIISGARVIDESYTGEFIASLINTSSDRSYLLSGTKFIQLVLVPINKDYLLEECSCIEELYEGKLSTRGAGAYGSTGKG